MPSSLNALLTAWAISLILVVGGTVFFELTYDPNAKEAEKQLAAASHQEETPDEELEETVQATAHEQHPVEDGQDEATQPAMRQDMATGMTEPVRQPEPQRAETIARVTSGVEVEADTDLIEQSNQGPLPKVSADGRRPFDVYSAPPPPRDRRPKIALVITDLGMRQTITRRAINDLPVAVTLAFSPYASNLPEWGEEARRSGHEVLLMVPMEPTNYPQNDPGPFTLLTKYSARENINMLKSSLGRLTGYVGIVNHMGARLTAAPESLRPILDEIKYRGLMFLDSRATPYSVAASMARDLGIPTSFNNKYVDENVNPGEIAKQLADLESRARTYDYAVGMGRPYPVTMDAIKVWSAGLERRGFVLVPISATANRQIIPN